MNKGLSNSYTRVLVVFALFSIMSAQFAWADADEGDVPDRAPTPSVEKPTEEKPTEVKPPPREDKVVVAPPEEKHIVKLVDHDVVEEPATHHIDFSIGWSSRPNNGCLIAGCGAIIPVQQLCGSQYIAGFRSSCPAPIVRRRIVYLTREAPSILNYRNQNQGNFNANSPTQPLTLINTTPPPIWATTNFLPRWTPYEARLSPVLPPQQQFTLPTFNQTPLGERDIGQIYRTGAVH